MTPAIASIRVATAADAERISELLFSLAPYLLQERSAELPASLAQSLSPEACAARLAAPNFQSYLLLQGGSICAYLALRDGNYLYHLFTAATHHRQGLARELWQHVVIRKRLFDVRLRASLYAVAAYQRLGFSCEGQVGDFEGYRFQAMRWQRGT